MAVLVLAMSVASATDWQQFQKDEINTGWTTDYAPIYDPTLGWYKQTTGTGMGGIDVVPIVGDGQVFVLDYVGNVWAFNATTGQLNWNRSCTAPGTFELSTPAYNDGILYVATSAGDLNQGYCRVTTLYANNGTERENITLKTTGGYQLYTPVTYADDRIYLGDWNGSATTTNGSGTYYCLNASDVTHELWNYTPNRVSYGYRWAGAAIIGEYIVFGDTAANVTCLYNDNGTFVDYINIACAGCSGGAVEEIRSSIVWNESTGHIYFTAGRQDTTHSNYGSGHVYAVSFNAATGDLGTTCTWSNDTWYTTSTPVYYDDRIYVGGGARMGSANAPGRMRCLNATTGSMIWEKWVANGRVQASPAVSVVGGRKFIYYTTNVHNGSAYCLEDMGSTYATRWVWNPPAPDNQYILQGMAISDGMVYFGTDYGRIYALNETPEQFEIPIYNGKNLIAIPLTQDDTTLNAVFGANPVQYDQVRRYNNSQGLYQTSMYTGTAWWTPGNVEPIEPEVGYEYERKDASYVLTVRGTRGTGMISTPIVPGKNLIGYVNLTPTDLGTFGANPVQYDQVRRYNNSQGLYQTSMYTGTAWWTPGNVEPIEAGVGYEYERKSTQFNWIYYP